jgi:hypothetical protein
MSDLIVRNIEGDNRHWHSFPVIDFKFRNSGAGAALLSKYHIEVLDSEINVSPYLKFDWSLNESRQSRNERSISSPTLEINVRNFGWGEARSLSVLIKNKMLSDLFDSKKRSIEVVHDDNKISAFVFDIKTIRRDIFLRHAALNLAEHEVSRKSEYGSHEMYRGSSAYQTVSQLSEAKTPFVLIDKIPLDWRCLDVCGRSYTGQESVSFDRSMQNGSAIIITEDAFTFVEGDYVLACMMDSGPTFCALIDPDKGAHVRSYAISRRIGAGDVERFQVLVGATKSCSLKIRLAFDVDGENRVQSKVFELNIENRRDQKLHYYYRDGQEILAEVTARQESFARSSGPNYRLDDW